MLVRLPGRVTVVFLLISARPCLQVGLKMKGLVSANLHLFKKAARGGAKTAWMGKTLGMWLIFHERLGYVGLKYWESFLRNVGMEPAKLWDVLLKTLNTRW